MTRPAVNAGKSRDASRLVALAIDPADAAAGSQLAQLRALRHESCFAWLTGISRVMLEALLRADWGYALVSLASNDPSVRIAHQACPRCAAPDEPAERVPDRQITRLQRDDPTAPAGSRRAGCTGGRAPRKR